MNKISILLFLFSNIVFAAVPEEFENHIVKNLELLKTIQYKQYTKPQKDLIIDNFIDGMAEKYQIKDFDLTEVQNLIYSKIKTQKKENYLPLVNPDYLNLLTDLIKDSNLKFDKNILTISYQGLDIPFFAKTEYGVNKLTLDGIFFQDHCLSLTFNHRTMNINYLGTVSKACPIPRGRGAGTFLLKLAEEVAKKLKIQEISLEDESKVKCSKNNKEVSLKILKYFQNGKSWYGSHGYIPKDKNIIEYEKEIEELRNYPLSSIQKLFNTIAMSDLEQIKNEEKENYKTPRAKRVDEYYDTFISIKEEFDKQVKNYKIQISTEKEEITLAEFFSWLWKEDCELYTKFINLIFPSPFIKNINLRSLIPKAKTYYKNIR